MGLREKVTLAFIVLVILQMTVNCLKLPQKYKNRNGALRKHPSKYNPLQQTQSFKNHIGSPEKYGDSIRKYFDFPEIEYSGKSKCFPNYQYQELNSKTVNTKNSFSTQELDFNSHDVFSTCNQKNFIKKSINSNTKTEKSAPVLFSEFSSAPNYRDIFYNFPDVEYPLCASETWKPYYFNGYLTDTPSNNNLYSSDKKLNRSEGKSFANIIKSNKIMSSCGFNKAPEKVTMIDKNLNGTFEPKQISLNVTSCNTNATSIKTCESMLRNEDKNLTVFSRPEDCGICLLPTEDRENTFGLNDEDYTTDDPEYEERSPLAQSTVAPPVLTPNDITWENTQVIENRYVPDVDELNDYFMPV